ncbi:MAG TPA: hypothetical protein LFW14_00830 [Rickettsia endosymbiont of Degeeriella rufa]|nr:hypothetical protein [Rickettsia endosymbiont of Degeeriella rufa]
MKTYAEYKALVEDSEFVVLGVQLQIITNYLDIINEIIDLTNNENNIDNREEKFQDIQISLEQIKEKSKEDIIKVKEKLREILEYFVQDLYTTKNDLTKAEIFKITVNDYRICGDEEYR